MKKYTILFLILAFTCIEAASEQVDSLKGLINEKSGKELVDIYNKIAAELNNGSGDMYHYSRNAVELAKSEKYALGTADAYMNLGNYHFEKKDYTKAIEQFNIAKKIYNEEEEYLKVSNAFNRIGLALGEMHNYDAAIESMRHAVAFLKNTEVNKYHSEPLKNLGVLYWKNNNYDSALVYYKDALQVALAYDDSLQLGKLYNNLGVIYWQWSLYDKAAENYQSALEIRTVLKDSLGVGRILNNLGLTYMETEKYEEAREYFNEADKLAKTMNKPELQGYSEYNIGLAFSRQGILDSAFAAFEMARISYRDADILGGDLMTTTQMGRILNEKEKPDEALEYLEYALKVADEINNIQRQAIALKNIGISYFLKNDYYTAERYLDSALVLSENKELQSLSMEILFERGALFRKTGNYKNALDDYLQYYELKDSVKNVETKRRILEYQTRYESQKTQSELNKKEYELNRSELFLTTSVVAIIILGLFIILLVLILRSRNTTNKQLNETNVTIEARNNEIKKQKIRLEDAFVELNNRKNELDIVVATKDKLFSILAHDIKNPLGVVMNYAILLKDRANLSEIEIDQIADNIYTSSKKLEDLLNNILTWSRSQQGLININKEKFNIRKEIQNAVSPLMSWMHEKQLKYNLEVNAKKIYADRFMINTIIRNLIHNSIKFTSPGGTVKIEVHEDETNTYINVSDTGGGIKKEKIEHLFSGINDDSQNQGTGLGLKICKEFTEKQDGTISVISEVGSGTTFSIKLPKN